METVIEISPISLCAYKSFQHRVSFYRGGEGKVDRGSNQLRGEEEVAPYLQTLLPIAYRDRAPSTGQ